MRIPLSYKISFSVVMIVLIQTSVLLFNAYNDLTRDMIEETKQNANINLSRLQQTLQFLSAKNEIEQIQAELSSLGSIIHMKHAFLTNDNNIIVASSRLAHVGHDTSKLLIKDNNRHIISILDSVKKNMKPNLWINSNKNNLYAAYPLNMGIKQSQKSVLNQTGVIFAHIDLSWINTQVKKTLQIKAIPMILMLSIIAILFTLFLNRIIGRRISNINSAAKLFSDSGYSSRSLVKGNDELSDLAISFNHMAERVERQNKELVKKEENISLILNSMEDGVITIDETGIIYSFNQSAEKMFGYTEKEVAGKNINLILPEPHSPQHDDFILSYQDPKTHKINSIGRDLPVLHKDGHIFSIHMSLAEYPININGKRLYIGSCLDITAFKEQEQQLRHSQKMDALGNLTGGIAHDYNNMLGVILGYAELLKSNLSNNPKLLKYASEIHYAGERGAKLTKKLLAFSKKKSTELSTIDINALVQDNKNMLEKTLTARIQLTLELAPDLWHVYIDQNDLEDAMLNLCINAMHAMQNGGQLTLSTHNVVIDSKQADELKLSSSTNQYVHLSICDTGTGIDDEIVTRIFDPFFSTKGEMGNGLGLSQVYGFINRNNGAIKVESKLNQGSCFNLYFPRYKSDDSTKSVESQNTSVSKGDETILVVDDEIALLQLMKEILEPQGYHIILAESGYKALQILKLQHVDLMLSDIIMPEMDGYQLAQQVRDLYPSVKIQLSSGYSDNHQMASADLDLHSQVLHKPFNQQQLISQVRELLDRRQSDNDSVSTSSSIET